MSASYEISAEERKLSARAALTIPIHVLALGGLITGARPFDWMVLGVLYVTRMFFLTAGYHRYFAHRAFRTSRFFQFILALGGTTCVQRGPLWWAGHHRLHHKHTDDIDDTHTPKKGKLWSHYGWVLSRKNDAAPFHAISDFAVYPEIRWLDRHYYIVVLLLMLAVYAAGYINGGSLTSGASALFIGFFLSTVLLYQATYLVNSATHLWGTRRFATLDTSRNNPLVALLSHGEGWHNNHHHYPNTANQGFYWWEFDFSYLVLRGLAVLGLVWDLKTPSAATLARRRISAGTVDVGLVLAARERRQAAILGRKLTRTEIAYLRQEVQAMTHAPSEDSRQEPIGKGVTGSAFEEAHELGTGRA